MHSKSGPVYLTFARVHDSSTWQVLIERNTSMLYRVDVTHDPLSMSQAPDNVTPLRNAVSDRALKQLADGNATFIGVEADGPTIVAWNVEGSAGAQEARDYHTQRIPGAHEPMTSIVAAARAPEIDMTQVLKLSTNHLQSETRTNLNDYEGTCAVEIEGGWLMMLSTYADDDALTRAWPSELLPIVAVCKLLGCGFAYFHPDHERSHLLPAFPR